jgi:hypothetical protein
LQVAIPFSMQLVLPGWQTAATQALVLVWQYCPLGQSVESTHRTQDPVATSQSCPSGVQVRSEAHLVRQVSATHVFVVSAQSASMRQATHRPAVLSQTWELEHSSELWQGT